MDPKISSLFAKNVVKIANEKGILSKLESICGLRCGFLNECAVGKEIVDTAVANFICSFLNKSTQEILEEV